MRWSILLFALLLNAAWGRPSPQTPGEAQLASWFQAAQKAHARGDLKLAAAEYEKIKKARPDIPEVHSNLGVVYYMQGRYPDALVSFDEAMKRKPGLFVPLLFSGMSHARMRHFDKAVPLLEKALRSRPDDPQVLLYLGLSSARLGREQPATACLEKLVSLHPQDTEALYHLGKHYLELSVASFERVQEVEFEGFLHLRILAQVDAFQGKPVAALRARHEQVIAARPSYPDLRWELGQLLLRGGEAGEAMAALSEELELQPDHAPVLLLLAKLRREAGDDAGAASLLARANDILGRVPGSDNAFLKLLEHDRDLAITLLNAILRLHDLQDLAAFVPAALPAVGELAGTLGRLWQIVAAPPPDDWPLEVYVRSRLQQGELRLVRDQLLELARRSPGRAMPPYLLGLVNLRLSLAAHERLVALDPDGYRTRLLAAEALDSQQNYDGAIEAYQAALDRGPNVPGVHYSLGVALVHKRRLDESIAAFHKELEIDPYETMAMVRLGEVYTYQRQPQQAVPYLLEAVKLDSGIASAYSALGRARLMMGKPAEAAEALEKAVKLAPQDRQARYQLARAYQQLGRKEDAERELAVFGRLLRERTLGRQQGLLEADLPPPER